MATPETTSEQIPSTARMDDPLGSETIVPSYVTGLVIIGLAASFLVVIIGVVADRFVVVIAGSFATSAVTFVWAIAVAVGLWKSVKSWLASRRATANGPVDTTPHR